MSKADDFLTSDKGATLIIAEAGVNHNGSLARAREMVKVAAGAGADVIKFQAFVPELCASRHAPKAPYQIETTGEAESQLSMLSRLALREEDFVCLSELCRREGIRFLATPGDRLSLELLLRVGVDGVKIASGEITNWPFLGAVGAARLPVILSTGMSAPDEIAGAIAAISAPWSESVPEFNTSDHLALLHCVTEYPAPVRDANLRAIDTLREKFGVRVGFSDHTEGTLVAIAAAARGADIIEKHFTLDKTLPGPDHKASLDPAELVSLARDIRAVELALGDGEKKLAPSETANRDIVRRSLVALKRIKRGELFSEENLGAKRPGVGIPPTEYFSYLGRPADRDYEEDDLISGSGLPSSG